MLANVSGNYYCGGVSGFTKLFSSLIHSTVWREELHVKVVWITMLAMTDRKGQVFASIPGLADAARVTLEQCVDALNRFKNPDPWSRTKDHEGRRIREIDGGWLVLNYEKHRETRDADERRIQVRDAVRRYREKHGKPSGNHVSQSKPPLSQADADAEADIEALPQIHPKGSNGDKSLVQDSLKIVQRKRRA